MWDRLRAGHAPLPAMLRYIDGQIGIGLDGNAMADDDDDQPGASGGVASFSGAAGSAQPGIRPSSSSQPGSTGSPKRDGSETAGEAAKRVAMIVRHGQNSATEGG